VPLRAESNAVRAWLNDIAGQTKSLIEEIESADVVVMIVGAGSTADAAPLIGEACQLRHVTAVGLILQDEETADEAIERTLRKMRQFVTMLVVASGDEYAEAMLTALRA
jgi:fructoselysine-6-P-deglycase FrlB-like protein